MTTCGQASPRSSDGLPRLLQEPLRCSESTGIHSESGWEPGTLAPRVIRMMSKAASALRLSGPHLFSRMRILLSAVIVRKW